MYGKIRSWRRWCSGWVMAAVALTVMLASPEWAHAQRARTSMRMGPGGMTASPVSSRELDKWISILSLNKEQAEAAKALHEGYRDEHRAQSKALQDLVKNTQAEFMESQDTSVFKDIAAKSAKFTDRMTELDKQFMDDVKALLDASQLDRFPRVERHHRRVKSLPSGMLAGESANLITVLEDTGLGNAGGELGEAVEQYEIELDRAIVERDTERKEYEKQSQEMMKDFDPAKMDFTKLRDMMKGVRATGVKVRDVNDRFARKLATLVPDDKKSDFEARARKVMFPAVYREPYAVKAIAAAEDFDDLTAEQRESIAALKQGYDRERTASNEKWAAAIAVEEKDGGGDPFMGFGRMMPGAGDEQPSPAEEAKKARMALDKTNLEKLKAILTDAQKDRLPERGEENPWMANFGGGGDDDADEEPAKKDRRK